MNAGIINNWNSIIKDTDTVFILGDIGFCGYEKLKPLVSQLKGKKYLIQGNHDSDKIAMKLVSDNIIYGFSKQALIYINDRVIHLSHFPFLCIPDEQYQLFGHVHLSQNKNYGNDFNRCSYLLPNQYEVGVDFNNYTPISGEKVLEKINYQIKNNVNCLYWIGN